jgi:hypothetical protein
MVVCAKGCRGRHALFLAKPPTRKFMHTSPPHTTVHTCIWLRSGVRWFNQAEASTCLALCGIREQVQAPDPFQNSCSSLNHFQECAADCTSAPYSCDTERRARCTSTSTASAPLRVDWSMRRHTRASFSLDDATHAASVGNARVNACGRSDVVVCHARRNCDARPTR